MPEHLSTIHAAAQRLREGGVVAFPTETVYGLGADALNAAAVERVFALKGRPAFNPLIVHVSDEAMARRVASKWPKEAEALARAFWPGPLTVVVPKGGAVPSVVTGGAHTVAVRCPDHPLAIALIEAFGGPLVGPSANLSGRVSPTTAEHVRESFRETDVMVLDGGACRAGIESTVLSLADPRGEPTVLRRGVVTPEMIARVLGRPPRVADGDGDAGGTPAVGGAALASPGMMRSHYAPRAPAVLFGTGEWPGVRERAKGGAVVVLTSVRGREAAPPSRVMVMPSEPTAYAARLYAALREADALRPDLIAIEEPTGDGGVWDAVRDRLRRATAER